MLKILERVNKGEDNMKNIGDKDDDDDEYETEEEEEVEPDGTEVDLAERIKGQFFLL